MKATAFLLATAVAIPGIAGAATFNVDGGTIYTDETQFRAAIGTAPTVTEDFSGYGNTELENPTVFSTGVSVSLDMTAGDVRAENDVLLLSLEDAQSDFAPSTMAIDFLLPNQSTFFGITFGDEVAGNQGIGNDSGSRMSVPGIFDAFDPDTLYAGSTDGNPADDMGYIGFFGFVSDSASFDTISLFSAGENGANDDDFKADDLIFADVSPVPVPAALPLLLAGLGGFAFFRRRG